MIVASIHQPNYFPWLGFFQKLAMSDVFIFYDNVQMPMGKSLVTRNQFKSTLGPKWLTVPTFKTHAPKMICETNFIHGTWQKKHKGSLKQWYHGCDLTEEICALLDNSIANSNNSISRLNINIITGFCEIVGINDVDFIVASKMKHGISGADSIIPILTEVGASQYVTGQGAGTTRHMDFDKFNEINIDVTIAQPANPIYQQKHGAFENNLSAVDVLLNVGRDIFLKFLRDNSAI